MCAGSASLPRDPLPWIGGVDRLPDDGLDVVSPHVIHRQEVEGSLGSQQGTASVAAVSGHGDGVDI